MSVINQVFKLASTAVIKEGKRAERNETTDSLKRYQRFRNAYFGYGYEDKNKEDQRKRIMRRYTERNDYYRMLKGMPPIGEPPVILDQEILGVDTSKPLHEMSNEEIAIVKYEGVIDELIEDNPNKDYLKFLDRRLEYVYCREAENFELLDLKNDEEIDEHIYEIFKEKYIKNRLYFQRTIYNSYYHEHYEYYEPVMIDFLVISSIASTIDHLNINIIDDNTLDRTSMRRVLKEYGFPDWVLPSRILRGLTAIINDLTMYKGTKKTIMDIIGIFDLDIIYRYYLYKRPLNRDENRDAFEHDFVLEFVKVPFGEKDIFEYVRNENNRTPYGDFIRSDPTWREDSEVLDKIMDADFSIISTKYLSVEEINEISSEIFKMTLFFQNMVENGVLTRSMTLTHQYVTQPVSLFDLILYSVSLIIRQYGYVDDVIRDFDRISHIVGMNDKYDPELIKLELYKTIHDSDLRETIRNYESYGDVNSIGDMMGVYASNYSIIERLRCRLKNETDYDKYKLLKDILDGMTILQKNNEVFKDENGEQYETYSDYIKNNNESLYQRLERITESINDNLSGEEKEEARLNRFERINDELMYVTELMESYLNRPYSEAVYNSIDFMDEMISSELTLLQRYLYKILKFFKSHTDYIQDFSLLHAIDDKSNGVNFLEKLFNHETDVNNHGISVNGKMLRVDDKDDYKEKISIKEELIEKDYNSKGGFKYYEND